MQHCSAMCRFGGTAEERFWAKVDKGDGEGCWLWAGGTGAGCGIFTIDGKHTLAHRYSYALKNGPIPEGLQILHECDVPLCCNPSHLRVGNAQMKHGADNASTNLAEDDVLAIYRRAHSGENKQVIATDYGISVTSVYNITNKASWKYLLDRVDVPEVESVDGSRSSDQYNATLNDDLVRTLGDRCDAEEHQLELTHEYRMSIGTVKDAVGRKTWRHVA